MVNQTANNNKLTKRIKGLLDQLAKLLRKRTPGTIKRAFNEIRQEEIKISASTTKH